MAAPTRQKRAKSTCPTPKSGRGTERPGGRGRLTIQTTRLKKMEIEARQSSAQGSRASRPASKEAASPRIPASMSSALHQRDGPAGIAAGSSIGSSR